MCGNVHKTNVNGRKSWRQLRCLKSMPSGVAEPVDLSGLDFAQLNWTPAVVTSASIMCGNVHKTDVNGRKSWRQLRCLKSMPPDDDDDDCPPHGSVRVRTRLVDRIGSEVRVRVRTRLVSWIGSGVRVRVRTRLVSRTGSGVRVNVSFRIFHNTEQHQAPPSKTGNSIQTVRFSVRKDRK